VVYLCAKRKGWGKGKGGSEPEQRGRKCTLIGGKREKKGFLTNSRVKRIPRRLKKKKREGGEKIRRAMAMKTKRQLGEGE